MRRIVRLACLVTASFGTVACRPAPLDLEAVQGELMEADRTFARETASRGAEGWVEAFAEDGKMFGPGPIIQGHDAIREAMAGIGKAGNTLEWEPVFAEAGPSGDFGYTHGTYRRQRIDANGNPVIETGKYVSIWRRDASGKFRVVLDTGTPDPPTKVTPPSE